MNNNLNKRRLEILDIAKKHIPFDGWNEKIFSTVAKNLNKPVHEVDILFEKNYRDLLNLYLDNSENKMIKAFSKRRINGLKTNEKINKIIMFRIKQNLKEKELVRKTFFTLMLPTNTLLGINSLYRTVDNIWYLSGDTSSDFNFYTKRTILAGIYSSVLFFWLTDDSDNLENVKIFLEKKLNKASILSKIKKTFSNNY